MSNLVKNTYPMVIFHSEFIYGTVGSRRGTYIQLTFIKSNVTLEIVVVDPSYYIYSRSPRHGKFESVIVRLAKNWMDKNGTLPKISDRGRRR